MKSEWTWRGVSAACAAFAVWALMSAQHKAEGLETARAALTEQVVLGGKILTATTDASQRLAVVKTTNRKLRLRQADELKDIIKSDPETKAWADQPVPPDVIIWVRQTPSQASTSEHP